MFFVHTARGSLAPMQRLPPTHQADKIQLEIPSPSDLGEWDDTLSDRPHHLYVSVPYRCATTDASDSCMSVNFVNNVWKHGQAVESTLEFVRCRVSGMPCATQGSHFETTDCSTRKGTSA